jgi:hypothetical protein
MQQYFITKQKNTTIFYYKTKKYNKVIRKNVPKTNVE